MKLKIVILSVAKNLSRMRVFNSDIRQRFLVVLLLGMTIATPPVFAAESSPSADIKAKLEELKKEIASKAAQIKKEVDRKLQNKAYVGKVKAKSDSSLTLATLSGPKIVNVNQDTVFDSKVKSKQKFSLKTTSEEDYVAALGDADETGILTAKKVILLPIPKDSSKTYLWGQVISISDQLSTLRSKDFKNIAIMLPSSSGVKLNNFVILTGTKDKNDIFKAGFVYVIPQGGVIKPKKIATPSAKSATPSAKPRTSF